MEPWHGYRIHLATPGKEHELIGVGPMISEEDPLRRVRRNAHGSQSSGRLPPLMHCPPEGNLGHQSFWGTGLDQLSLESTAIELDRLDFPAQQCVCTLFEVVEPD